MTVTERGIALVVLGLLVVGILAMLHQSPTTLPAGCVYQEAG